MDSLDTVFDDYYAADSLANKSEVNLVSRILIQWAIVDCSMFSLLFFL